MKTKIDKSKSRNISSSPFFNSKSDPGFFNIQPKLKVGQPGDKYEVEADRVADVVVSSQAENQPFFTSGKSQSLVMMKESENNFDSSLLEREVIPAPKISTKGTPVNYMVLGNGSSVSISLQGTTKANFKRKWSVTNISETPATDCDGCSDDECLNISGTMSLVFNANPVVTLPSRSEYDHLSPCQIQRVEQWIQNVLAPHEQDHVDAFNTYDGTVQEQFQFKKCRSERRAVLQSIFNRIEEPRRQSAQDLSDALDPFYSNIDLDCEDEEQQAEGTEVVEQQCGEVLEHTE